MAARGHLRWELRPHFFVGWSPYAAIYGAGCGTLPFLNGTRGIVPCAARAVSPTHHYSRKALLSVSCLYKSPYANTPISLRSARRMTLRLAAWLLLDLFM